MLYRRLGLPAEKENGTEPRSVPAGSQEGTEPVRRRTFVELTGISIAGAMLPSAVCTGPTTGIEPLVLMLTGDDPGPSVSRLDLADLAPRVARARKDYQACRYAELVSRLPGLLSQLDSACCYLSGDDRLHACVLSADAYHVIP